MAALLGAQNVAGAANLQVTHSDLEAGPQFAELFDRLHSFSGRAGQRLAFFEQEVAVRSVLIPTDASAQLMQIS